MFHIVTVVIVLYIKSNIKSQMFVHFCFQISTMFQFSPGGLGGASPSLGLSATSTSPSCGLVTTIEVRGVTNWYFRESLRASFFSSSFSCPLRSTLRQKDVFNVQLKSQNFILLINLLSFQKLLHCKVGPQSLHEIFILRRDISGVFCHYSVLIRHITAFLLRNKNTSEHLNQECCQYHFSF